MSYKIKKKSKIHTNKFDRCVKKVENRGDPVNPFALCQKSLKEKAIKKSHRRKYKY